MNYIGRFGLEFNPFLKTARHETVIETTEYKESTTALICCSRHVGLA